ncbi:MAG: phytanoyl-CoA dioxygenase family protein [Parachlamydiaceae bacterium]|nr:phytanoyl-CoA dioxygenase family protein [Parachlamydiaceae bacterium]
MKKIFHMQLVILLICIFSCRATWAESYLNSDEIARYQKDGYLVIEHFISNEECDALKLEAHNIIHEYALPLSIEVFRSLNRGISQEMHYFEKQASLCIFFNEKAFLADGSLSLPLDVAVTKISHALHDINHVFSTFSRQNKIAALISDLGLTNPLLVQSMMIFKQPKTGNEVSCHQDGTFLYTEPDTTIGLWFALEDTSIDNGCLWVIPGGHSSSLKYRFKITPEKGMHFINLDDTPWELDKMIPLRVSKGSLIVLHGQVPHMSKANISSSIRPAYTLHLIDSFSQYSSENWLQRSACFPFKGF